MKITNLTSSNLPIGSFVLRANSTRSVPPSIWRTKDAEAIIQSLEKHDKIKTEREAIDDAESARPKPQKHDDDSVVRPVPRRPKPIPGTVRELSRDQLAVATRPVLNEYAAHLGIRLSAIELMADDEARLFIGAIALGDPGLYTQSYPGRKFNPLGSSSEA